MLEFNLDLGLELKDAPQCESRKVKFLPQKNCLRYKFKNFQIKTSKKGDVLFKVRLFFLNLFLFSSVFANEFPSQFDGFNLETGNSVHFSSQTNKPLVVIFLSAKCPCSNSHITEVKSLSEKFPNFAFVAINSNVDEDQEMAKKYFSQAHLSFPVIKDSESKLANAFKALKTPHAFVINSKGEALYRGGVSDSSDCTKSGKLFLRQALMDIAANHEVKIPIGRTLGCSISRDSKNVW